MNNNRIVILDIMGLGLFFLKITGFIDWPWWCVAMPFWGGFILSVLADLLFKINDKPKTSKSSFKEMLELKIKQSKENEKQRKL